MDWLSTHWHWVGFGAFVIVMLALDLGVFHKHSRETTMREAGLWTVIWCALAAIFNVWIFFWDQGGPRAAAEFLTGYLVEWSLSMDNVFVFAVIFGFFGVPRKYQHRVLFWGILGAVFMRLAFILAGSALIHRFSWVLPILGAFLLYTGVQLARKGEADAQPDKNPILRIARRFMRVSHGEHGDRFFVREEGKLAVTPLFMVLLVVETTDVVFAVDSVPAILGLVTADAPYFSFVVFTSNVFAILGLRALYFLLAGAMELFRYLAYGLSAILVVVGAKMIAQFAAEQLGWVEKGHHLIRPELSLAVVISLLTISIVASLVSARREARHVARRERRHVDESEPDAAQPPAVTKS